MIGGLWPAELLTTTAETAGLAKNLKDELQQIANSSNDELKSIRRTGMDDHARRAEEARVIDEARARAVRRVEAAIRHLHVMKAGAASEYRRPQVAEPVGSDLDKTQVIAAVTDPETATVTSSIAETQVIPAITATGPGVEACAASTSGPRSQIGGTGRHHAVVPGRERSEVAGHRDAVADNAAVLPAKPLTERPEAETEHDSDRLNRLLEFVVRQEPRLNWAVGDDLAGTTVLVTDLAHGWIPPGIALPLGVRLLEPEQRTGKVSALIADPARAATYAPGDSLRRSADFATTKSSLQPRRLPPVENLGEALGEATGRRDGLPRIVYRLAAAAAAGGGVIDQEVDVLRVHLDTARHQLLVQYPDVSPALLLDCLLLAATESFVGGDAVSANYHLAWYRCFAAAPPSR